VRGKQKTIGTADLKCIHYTISTTQLERQTDCYIQITSCKAVQLFKFWNKIHGWFHSHFLKIMVVSIHPCRLTLFKSSKEFITQTAPMS